MELGIFWVNDYIHLFKRYTYRRGDGYSFATQTATALSQLISRWYNDGEIYDNCHSTLVPFKSNYDISTFANWIWFYHPDTRKLLQKVWECKTDDEYELILVALTKMLIDEQKLKKDDERPKVSSIYTCEGVFEFIEDEDDDDEDEFDFDKDDY